jgi:hypothetical protein
MQTLTVFTLPVRDPVVVAVGLEVPLFRTITTTTTSVIR